MMPINNFRQKALEKAEGTRLCKLRKTQQLLEYENKTHFRKLGFCWFVWQRWESDEGKHPDKGLPCAIWQRTRHRQLYEKYTTRTVGIWVSVLCPKTVYGIANLNF